MPPLRDKNSNLEGRLYNTHTDMEGEREERREREPLQNQPSNQPNNTKTKSKNIITPPKKTEDTNFYEVK